MTDMQRKQTVEIKELCIYMLRRWRLLIVAALIGAVLFGGYRIAMQTIKGQQLVLTEEEMEAAQEDLEGKEETIADTRESIQDNKTAVSDIQKTITQYESLQATAMESNRISASTAIELAELTEKILEMKNTLKNTQRQIEDYEESVLDVREDIAKIQEDMAETVPLYSGKDIVIGILFGGLLGALFAVVYVFFNSYKTILRNGEELRQWYAFPLLCDLHMPGTGAKNRRRRGMIDRVLDRLEGLDEVSEPETAFAVAAAKLQLLSDADVPVVLAGTADTEKMEVVCTAIRRSLPPQAKLLVAGNPMKQPEAVSRLSGAAVVLVEEAGCSHVKKIHQVIDFLNASKTPVIAVVVL